MRFPVRIMDDNRLASLSGEVSSFYSFKSTDIETLDEIELDSYLESFKREISEDGSFFKFYHLESGNFVNTDSKPNFDIEIVDDPLNRVFGEINSDIHFYPNYLSINNECIQILSLKDFPKNLDLNAFRDFEYVVNLRKVDTDKSKFRLDLKRKLHHSSLFKDIKDIESEKSFGSNEDYLEQVTTGSEFFFDVEVFFVLRGSTPEGLKTKQKLLKNYLKNFDASFRIETGSLSFFFYNLLPGVSPSFYRSRFIPGEYLLRLLPFDDESLMDRGIDLSSDNGRELKLSIFHPSNTNFNVLITGKSGEGKSMIANKIVFEEVESGSKVMIVDSGGSFEKTIHYLGGVHLETRFNPVVSTDPKYLIEIFKTQMSLSKKEEGVLFESLSEIKEKDFRKLLLKLEEKHPDIRYYFLDLIEYFTAKSEISDITYVDLEKYPTKVRSILLLSLIERFKTLEGKKIFLFDECWDLLNTNSHFIEESFRTFRKLQASAIAISQGVDDFLNSRIGFVVYQNSFIKLYFRQDIDRFKENIDSEKVRRIAGQKNLYSKFLVQIENLQKVVRYYPNQLEMFLFNTEREQKHYFERYKAKFSEFMNFRDLVTNFLNLKVIK